MRMLSVYKSLIGKNSFRKILPRRSLSKSFNLQASHDRNGQNDTLKSVAVIGGGIMGAGIAQAAAQNGFTVTVIDNDEYSQKCMVQISRSLDIIAKKKFPEEPKGAIKFRNDIFANITTKQHMEDIPQDVDIVIEAIVENADIKREIFQRLDQITPQKTIFASNTSSLSIDAIANSTNRPDRFGGLHFFNPVWAMKLCEVAKAEKTSDETYRKLIDFAVDVGKTPVLCKDIPGFIVNRLLFPYLMEALRLYERGHASIEDIDAAMRHGASHPVGPFELIDIIGLDIVKSAIDGWHVKEPDNELFRPNKILNRMVDEGKLGRKSMQGFYNYQHNNINQNHGHGNS